MLRKAIVSGILATVIGGIALSFINKPIETKENQPSLNILNVNSERGVVVGNNSTINNVNITKGIKTEIIEEIPDIPKSSRKGKCWTSSQVLRKPTAWRCSSNSNIFDPCIEILDPFNKGIPIIICKSLDSNFRMELIEPLPELDNWQLSANGNEVSKFKTFDGHMCYFQTGATVAHYERLNYSCDPYDSTQEMFILGYPTLSNVWTAKAVIKSRDGVRVQNKIVKIKTVWR